MAKAKAERIKLVMVGDEAVGKSCLLTGYTDNIFSSKYEPTVFVTHTAYIKNEEGDQVEIAVFDTAGTNLFSLVLIILIHNISSFFFRFILLLLDSVGEMNWNPPTQNMIGVFMTCGVDIAFLSVYPEEKEVLYPPLTYLQPVSVKRKRVGSRVMVVVEVKPILA